MQNTESRLIKFPTDRSMGIVYLRDIENTKKRDEYAEARGEINVPLDRGVELRVSYDAMSDLSPLSELQANDLQVLAITCTSNFDGTQLRYIEHLTGLMGLALWETDIEDGAFIYLRRMFSLRWLDIGDTKITDEGLGFVRGIQYLEELVLLNNKVGNNCLHHLENLKRLKRLDLMGTKVDDESFDLLRRLTKLESLRIMDTGISYPTYAKLKRALPDCQIKYHEYARI